MEGYVFKLIKSMLDQEELVYDVVDEEKGIIKTGFPLDNTNIILFITSSQEKYASIVGVDFVEVPKGKADAALRIVNSCNNAYSHIKFVYNEERNEITTECDAIVQPDTLGDEVMEIILRMLKVVDDAYPKMMKAFWAE